MSLLALPVSRISSFPDLFRRIAARCSTIASQWDHRPATVGLFTYHRIAPLYRNLPVPTLNVTPKQFRTQLRGMLARGVRFWPLSRLLDHAQKGLRVPENTAVITFDDAFANVYHSAFPVLCELRIPATVFLATAFIDSTEPFPFDAWGRRHAQQVSASAYLPLTTDQCRAMLASGLVELGAHTHTHSDFRGKAENFRADLAECVQHLHDRFGIDQPTFAFPFGRRYLGQVSESLLLAARSTGVRCALTTEAETVDPRTSPFGWGRFTAYDWDTAGTLAARLSGWYTWAPRLQEWMIQRSPGSLTLAQE